MVLDIQALERPRMRAVGLVSVKKSYSGEPVGKGMQSS